MVGTDPASAKGQATQQRILACAVARFADQGFRQASVAQIARDAELTPPAVHAYFRSKESLFRAAFDHDVAALLTVTRARLADGTFPGGGLTLVPELLQLIEDHRLVRRVFQGLEPDWTAQLLQTPAVATFRQQLVDTVAAAQAGGLLRADIELTALAGAMETLVLALLFGGIQVGMIGDESRRAAIAAILMKGIAAA